MGGRTGLLTDATLGFKGVRAKAYLGMVRNSIGADSYVADEIITSRAGVRVRVGNTDAEGRMVMADLLCAAKETALQLVCLVHMLVSSLHGQPSCLDTDTR